jgi:hypothetical protein
MGLRDDVYAMRKYNQIGGGGVRVKWCFASGQVNTYGGKEKKEKGQHDQTLGVGIIQ